MISAHLLATDLPADLQSVRAFRQRLADALVCTQLSRERQNASLLVFSELATNLVQHGGPALRTIGVSLTRESGLWRLEVSDDGAPFQDWSERMAAGMEQCEAEELALSAEEGRGLALVGRLFPDARYLAGEDSRERNRWLLTLGKGVASHRDRVLLVDDDPAVLQVTRAYLAPDYEVLAFELPSDALAAAKEDPPDLVIADVRMPGIDGLELRRRFASDPRTELVPFVFLTADRDEMTRNQAELLGIDDYLVKPVRKQHLASVVRRTLYRSRNLKSLLGERVGSAITNALRLELPSTIGGWRAEVRSINAEAGGGDFVRAGTCGPCAMLLLADVMGHGVAAKFFAHAHAGFLGGLLQARAESWGPSEFLAALGHRARVDKLTENSLLTCLAVRLCPGGSAEIGSAGHPAPLMATGNDVHQLEVSGALPGLLSDATYSTRLIQLAKHDRLLLFSDGLFEGTRDEAARKVLEAELLDTFATQKRLELSAQADALISTFEGIVEGDTRDDATFVLLEPL
jgi:CheY-like chemotaxis protein/anti-sigma regulatory factor (Ser/Thr protein kinase)